MRTIQCVHIHVQVARTLYRLVQPGRVSTAVQLIIGSVSPSQAASSKFKKLNLKMSMGENMEIKVMNLNLQFETEGVEGDFSYK